MPTRYELWYGRDEPPREARTLRAGPLVMQLDGGDLRYVRAGAVELVRRIYVAVRDLAWNTLPSVLANVRVAEEADAFTVEFDCLNRAKEIDFAWHGTIVGTSDGTITYTMDGAAQSHFRYAKIGICIHHPIRECVGRPYAGHTPAGPVSGHLPRTIGPQVHLDDGTDRPLFPPVDRLEIDLAEGRAVQFTFEGSLFEMEDQRNWTDASFKTASTPAYLGYVHDAVPGKSIWQRATVHSTGSAQPERPVDDLRVTIGPSSGLRLPPIGLGMASHGETLTAREADLLRRLRLDHVRCDLHLDDEHHGEALERAAVTSRALHCGLQLALFLGDEPEEQLAALAHLLAAAQVPLRSILVFRDGEEVAAGRWVRLARERLRGVAPHALFAGGTNIYFNELNRNRPEIDALDAVVYSINPQVHAFDEASLTEALEGQGETVASARAFCGSLPIIISPITLKPRFNPDAAVAAGERPAAELPDNVDPRQMSLFGAAWTADSVGQLAGSGVASLTYYETTGWRGLMEAATGSPEGSPFPSQAGMVFPLYHVFADLGEWASGEMLACRSGDPLRVTVLAIRAGGTHALIANMTASEQHAVVEGVAAPHIRLRRLNEHTAPLAMFDPERFRATFEVQDLVGPDWTLTLAPFEVARVDLAY